MKKRFTPSGAVFPYCWLLIVLAGVCFASSASAQSTKPGIQLASASIQITAPSSGATLPAGEPVVLRAQAIDPAGAITHVEFFDNGIRLGASDIQFIRAPDPGTPVQHEFAWTGAALGEHVIYASGVDSSGSSVFSGKIILQFGDRSPGAGVRIVTPKFGERFVLPEAIQFVAGSIDPKGAITHLDWLANGETIGKSDIFFIRSPEPGVSITHEFSWKNPKPGSYKVSALGTDSSGSRVESEAILVEVLDTGIVAPKPPLDHVEVEIVESDSVARRSDENGKVDAAVMKVRRTAGPRDVSVTVHYTVVSTGKAGIDFASLPGTVYIPAGEDSAALEIVPIPGRELGENQYVTVTLTPGPCPRIYPAPPYCYSIGGSASAKAVILADFHPTSSAEKSTGAIVQMPVQGAVFEAGKAIRISAKSGSSDNAVLLEILVDGKQIAASKDSSIEFEWNGAGPGVHSISARMTDPTGTIQTSPKTEVFVRDSSLSGLVLAPVVSAPTIQKIKREKSGKVQLQIGGPGTRLISIEASDDLNRWYQLDPALVPTDGVLNVEDSPDTKVESRFYRVKLLPMAP